jgi:hypothetical protein
MKPVDEVILETLRDEGNLTPQVLSEFDVATADYASVRLSRMTEYGLTQRIGRGLYRITEDGEAFLNEELDASTLERDEGSS